MVFCTGGAGSICSAQVRGLVYLGANACIVGRSVEKTEMMAKDIATARAGAQVLGLGAVDVRSTESLDAAVKKCVQELGAIDFVMYVHVLPEYSPPIRRKSGKREAHHTTIALEQLATSWHRYPNSAPTPSNPSSTSTSSVRITQ